MTPDQIELVQRSFDQVIPIKDLAAELFYKRLFELDPSLERLFAGDMHEQRKKLMAAIGTVVSGLKNWERVEPIVHDLGQRHVGYGAQPSNYDTVGEALLWTLEQGLGDAFTDPVKEAWTEAFGVVAGTMIRAAETRAA